MMHGMMEDIVVEAKFASIYSGIVTSGEGNMD